MFALPPDAQMSRANTDRTMLASRHRGMSLCAVDFEMMIGVMAADAPAITNVLNRLLPTMLLALSAVAEASAEMLATKLTMNSGSDVPKATIVRPMTISEMPKRAASPTAPSVSLSAPTRTSAAPITVYNMYTNINYLC